MGIELGIGEMLLVKAIAESTGRATTKIKEDLRREGDLGKVAMVSQLIRGISLAACVFSLLKVTQISRSNQPTMFKPKPLTVPGVFKDLTDIAKATGNAVRSLGSASSIS